MEEQDSAVIVGVGQLVQRGVEPGESLDPLAMLKRVATDAALDAGGGPALLRMLDTICLVDAAGWHPDNGPALLAEAVDAPATSFVTAALGGESGLTLLNHAATRIAAGQSRAAFVGGVNLLKTLRTAIATKVRLPWPKGGSGVLQTLGEARPGDTPLERRHGLKQPTDFYPVFENALRARRGADLETHRHSLGRLFSPFTRVAAQNPHAWFPVERSAQELVAITPHNRMIAYPYPKYLNAVMDTDQAAGVLLMSSAAARAAGIARERCVHWLGGALAQERSWFVSERSDLSRSAALAECGRRVLDDAGVAMDSIDFVDFYSCFPVAVELACEAYGIAPDDPRGLTVTGGLPYAGGPASNYTTHAVAALVDRLRARPGALGLATGNGWYLTKHSATLLGTEPPARRAKGTEAVADLPKAVGDAPLAIAQEPVGAGVVEAYTVTYDRQGAPERGIVLGRLDSGERFVANTAGDRALLESMTTSEFCGVRGRVGHEDGLGLFAPD